MFSGLIPVSMLTEYDLKRQRDYQNRRNLYNRYTEEQLDNWLCVDLYEALDLDFYKDKDDVPESVLQYAVKWKSAMYHPTKNRGRQQAFFIVRRAESVLSNPKYRKVYDSCFLDESLPEDKEYKLDEFIQVFSDVFRRNGIFSQVKPVPEIDGDLETFYKFWQNFKTNRVYDNPEDVFDVNGSTRRYNADKNKEIMQEKKIKDLQRIQELVRLAIKRDPRIKRKVVETEQWNETEVKSLIRFDGLFGKAPNKFDVIAKKLNELFLTKRSSGEIKNKIDELKKKH